MKKLKKNHYRCYGGNHTTLYLPGLVDTPLPEVIPFDTGVYARSYDPETDTTNYIWKEQ